MAITAPDTTPVVVARTKLRPPPARAQAPERVRLTEALERAIERRVTLVSAPAGYGKTTALAAWARARPSPTAWLSLDDGDADSDAFIAHLAAALGTSAVDGRAVATGPGAGRDAALARLLNELDVAAVPRVVVVDDLHSVAVPEVLEVVRRLVDHPPEGLRLVLATRVDPGLPLARWRVAGDLSEVRAPLLAFDRPEARALLTALDVAIDDDTLDVLLQRTEGWGAGLQLAGLSLRGRRPDGQRDFVERFTGRDRYVLAYLMEEVLQRLGPDLHDFLLQVSVLETVDAATAAAITGRADAASVLGTIERANLFLTRSDDGGYRFHAFFRDLLVGRLTELRPDLPRVLQARVAEHRSRSVASVGPGDRAPGAISTEGPLGGVTGSLTSTGVQVTVEPLTDRELQVLRRLATGATNKAIARSLGLSPNTVKSHLKHAFEKLGVATRTAAVARARDLQLL